MADSILEERKYNSQITGDQFLSHSPLARPPQHLAPSSIVQDDENSVFSPVSMPGTKYF